MPHPGLPNLGMCTFATHRTAEFEWGVGAQSISTISTSLKFFRQHLLHKLRSSDIVLLPEIQSQLALSLRGQETRQHLWLVFRLAFSHITSWQFRLLALVTRWWRSAAQEETAVSISISIPTSTSISIPSQNPNSGGSETFWARPQYQPPRSLCLETQKEK